MNKKLDPEDVRNHNFTIRLTKYEMKRISTLAQQAGFSNPTEFAREMLLKGYVQAKPTKEESINVKELREMLIEFRTNFNRISSYIKYNDFRLVKEIESTTVGIKRLIEDL